MLRRSVFVAALVVLFLLPTHDRIVGAADNPLEGAWQVMDVGGQPAAGVYIFTAKHYSIMFATTDRPQIDDTSKATADELRAMWGPMRRMPAPTMCRAISSRSGRSSRRYRW